MPTITLDKDRFSFYLGRDISVEDMAKWLPWLGTDTEEVGEDYVKIEYNPNRVDFCSYSGLARALQGLLGWKTGLPQFDESVIRLKRLHIAGATECSVDRQGRILIPPMLREYAGLNQSVLFAGLGTNIEIWDRPRWENERSKAKENLVEINETLARLGL